MFFLVIACPAFAQEVGKIISLVGKAEVFRNRQWQPISVGETLSPGDVVRIGPEGRTAIQLADGSQLKINANSRLEIKQVTSRPFVRVGVLQTLLRLFSGGDLAAEL